MTDVRVAPPTAEVADIKQIFRYAVEIITNCNRASKASLAFADPKIERDMDGSTA